MGPQPAGGVHRRATWKLVVVCIEPVVLAERVLPVAATLAKRKMFTVCTEGPAGRRVGRRTFVAPERSRELREGPFTTWLVV